MTGGDAAHWNVAAYALGVLDDTDSMLFEAHLAVCHRCSGELESLLPVRSVLSDVDASALRDATPGDMSSPAPLSPAPLSPAPLSPAPLSPAPLFTAVRQERRRDRRRQLATAAAAAAATVAIASSSLFAGARWLGDNADPVVAGPSSPPAATGPAFSPPPGSGIGGPDLADGELTSVTDPHTGVRADVVVEEKNWGTQVSFALWAVSGPLVCQLLVVDASGSTEVVSSWRVPPDGYGTPEHPAPLMLQAATAVPRAELSHLEIQAVDPGGITTLVTVRL